MSTLFMYICFVMLYCIALPARVLFAIKIIIIKKILKTYLEFAVLFSYCLKQYEIV